MFYRLYNYPKTNWTEAEPGSFHYAPQETPWSPFARRDLCMSSGHVQSFQYTRNLQRRKDRATNPTDSLVLDGINRYASEKLLANDLFS